MDIIESVIYRRAFGLASDLAEARSYGMAWGPACASKAATGDHRAIRDEVLGRLDVTEQGAAAEVVREAVADALEGRPRWLQESGCVAASDPGESEAAGLDRRDPP
jgi:hypothetical protein